MNTETLKTESNGFRGGDSFDGYEISPGSTEGYHLTIKSNNNKAYFRSGKTLLSSGTIDKVLDDVEKILGDTEELDTALVAMGKNNHDTAHFGMFGVFIYTEQASKTEQAS